MEQFKKLKSEYSSLHNELQVCKRKLDSKCEALLILSRDLESCRVDRDRLRQAVPGVRQGVPVVRQSPRGPKSPFATQSDQLNNALQLEAENLHQQLRDAHGDIKLLREQIARQRVGTTNEGLSTRHFSTHERDELVRKIEEASEQRSQSERDLQQVLDEKEDLVTERDAFKTKYERLNRELNYILQGEENRIVDIDALSMDNKFLQERLKQMEEEKSVAMATVSKYKTMLERKKAPATTPDPRQSILSGRGNIVSQKQVSQILATGSQLPATPSTVRDLQGLATALLEALNDKNLALSHQRKANKLLGTRVSELEKKLKTLEVSGFWNLPGKNNLDRLRELGEEMDSLNRELNGGSPRTSLSDASSDLMHEFTRDAGTQTEDARTGDARTDDARTDDQRAEDAPTEPSDTGDEPECDNVPSQENYVEDERTMLTLCNNSDVINQNASSNDVQSSDRNNLLVTFDCASGPNNELRDTESVDIIDINESSGGANNGVGESNVPPGGGTNAHLPTGYKGTVCILQRASHDPLVNMADKNLVNAPQPMNIYPAQAGHDDPTYREFGVVFQQPYLPQEEELEMEDISDVVVVKNNVLDAQTIGQKMDEVQQIHRNFGLVDSRENLPTIPEVPTTNDVGQGQGVSSFLKFHKQLGQSMTDKPFSPQIAVNQQHYVAAIKKTACTGGIQKMRDMAVGIIEGLPSDDNCAKIRDPFVGYHDRNEENDDQPTNLNEDDTDKAFLSGACEKNDSSPHTEISSLNQFLDPN